MEILCAKCGTSTKKPHDCEHTDEQPFCTECYTELHYYMTEPE